MGTENRISKAQNPYAVVRLGDPVALENFEFIVRDNVAVQAQPGDHVSVDIGLEKKGYDVVAYLISIIKKEK